MFDGLLKSKFYCKCKSDIKMARTRIEIARKKRIAMQKYLRIDVADLLRNGLDVNAYGRADGLLVEMIRTSCYDFVDQCCEHISKNVSAMDKQRECPEECREAVSTLMFAAARFADLPELRELRTLFSERYANSLDCFINKEFVEKMKSGPASKDSKLQLLQEIAAESGLDWDSKALENKLFNDSAYNENIAKEAGNIDGSDQKKDHKGGAARELMQHAREFKPEKRNGLTRHEQKEASRNEDRLPKKKETAVHPAKDNQVDTIRKTESKDDNNLLKYKSVAPPYTKSEVEKPKSVRRRNLKPEIDGGGPEEKRERTNKEKAAQGQRILRFFDDDGEPEKQDDDEKVLDKLLQLYSRKNGPSATDEKGKAMKPRTNRLSSLPVGLAEFPEGSKKQHTRSSSLQLDGNSNGHVHPKLPDYDDFVARLAAFRGSKD
ncbi:ist1-like protein [Phtheirospermum japonicum]|uniref:Ist1-like protein n=1 Tax=Phtheirospermum japonicum TaxID=374723 RepID=A0A830C3N8_9LAMI|nr:ist1-like protein [Phtheirospermum japonicum]